MKKFLFSFAIIAAVFVALLSSQATHVGKTAADSLTHSVSIPSLEGDPWTNSVWVTNGLRRATLNVEVQVASSTASFGTVTLLVEGSVTNEWTAFIDNGDQIANRTHHFSDVLDPGARWKVFNVSDPEVINAINKVKISEW